MFQEHLEFDPHFAICAEYRRRGFVLVTLGVNMRYSDVEKCCYSLWPEPSCLYIQSCLGKYSALWLRFSGQIARCLAAEGVVPLQHSYTPCWLVWLVGLEYHHASGLQILYIFHFRFCECYPERMMVFFQFIHGLSTCYHKCALRSDRLHMSNSWR